MDSGRDRGNQMTSLDRSEDTLTMASLVAAVTEIVIVLVITSVTLKSIY